MSTENNNWVFAISIFAIFSVAMIAGPALCQSQTPLMVHQSPVQGGQINIGTGVHYFGQGDQVNLVATPKPGYRFIYWLGDVSDETSNSTTAFLDNPKIVVAVYERAEFAALEERTFAVQNFSPPNPRTVPVITHTSNSGGSPQEKPDDPDPNPTPEPATVFLLTLGGLLVRKKLIRTS